MKTLYQNLNELRGHWKDLWQEVFRLILFWRKK